MSSEVSHGYTTDEGSMEHREYKEERSRVSFDVNMGANFSGRERLQMEGEDIRMEPALIGNKDKIEAELSQAGNYSPSTHTTPSTPSRVRKSLEETGMDKASVNVEIALPNITAEVAADDSQSAQSSLVVQEVTVDDTKKLQQSLLNGELNL